MDDCKFRQFELVDGNLAPVDYTCSDLEMLKKRFRQVNGTDSIINMGRRDMAYDRYCEQIDRLVSNCNCNPISMKCEKCSEEEHEGHFCRCENRNIQLAKQLRKEGKSSWINSDGQQGGTRKGP